MEFVAPQFNPPADILGAYLRGQMAPGIVQEQQQQLQQGADTNQYNQLKLQQMRMALQLGQRAMQSQAPQQEPGQPGMEGLQEQHPRTGAQEGYLPSDYNISAAPVPQIDPALGTALSNLAGGESVYKTLLESQKLKEEQQQAMVKTAQLKAQGPLMTFDAIAASPNPARMVMNNPSIMAQWPKAAMQLGLDPVKDFNDENVRQAAIFGSNQIRAAVGLQQSPYQRPTPITPFQNENLDVERQRLAIDRQKLGRDGAPSGYEPDPTSPGALRPIPGGPADPSGGRGQGSRAELMFNRVVSAGNEATAALKNISELPITASTGFFGTAQAGTGLLSSTKSVLAQKMTSQEVQDTKVMFAGVTRALGAIETSGLQVNGSLIHSMEAVTLNEGDTQITKLRKMAEIRQIVEKGLEPNLSNPKIPPEQKQLVRKIIDEIKDAVPYTHHDITQLQQSNNPQATISDFAKSSGVQKESAAYSDPDKEARYQAYKKAHGP